jgi:hypothetical protein
MAKRAARERQREATWRRRLGQQAGSGQSVRAWCRKHRVTEAAFYWWRRELARRDTEPEAASFMPVHITAEPGQGVDPQIEIVLTDGRRVRVQGSVDRQALADVLSVLTAASSDVGGCAHLDKRGARPC